MELSEWKRKQETRQLLLADCKEQAESAIRSLDDVVQALDADNAEIACGVFDPLPGQVRYVGLILQRLVTLTAEIRQGNKGSLGFRSTRGDSPTEGSKQ